MESFYTGTEDHSFFRISSYSQADASVQRYQEQTPLSIVFETVHPDDEEQNLVLSLFSPKECYNVTLSRDNKDNPLHRKGLHHHDFFELCYVISGEMYQNIEHKRHLYPAGSVCLLNQSIRHTEEFSTDYRCIFVGLSAQLAEELFLHPENYFFAQEREGPHTSIADFFSHNLSHPGASTREYMDFILCSRTDAGNTCAAAEREEMYRRFDTLLAQFLFPVPGSTCLLKGTLLQIFAALADSTKYQTVPVSIGTEEEARIFDRIALLLKENHGRLSRSELENAMNYHGAYLNKIIKKYTGLNLFHYGMTICMKEACRLLAQTDLSVSQIADVLRFSNRTHFYRLFEESFHMTPRQYRLMYRQQPSARSADQAPSAG